MHLYAATGGAIEKVASLNFEAGYESGAGSAAEAEVSPRALLGRQMRAVASPMRGWGMDLREVEKEFRNR